MPHVSRYKLDKKLEEKLLNNFYLILSKVNKTDSMEKFLLSLLSPTEQLMLAKRLGMFFLIQEGYSDSDIERMLHITRATISKFRYFIDLHGEGFEIASEILKNEELKAEFRSFLRDLAGYAARAAGGRVKPTIL